MLFTHRFLDRFLVRLALLELPVLLGDLPLKGCLGAPLFVELGV
jgi:hypothetical protein